MSKTEKRCCDCIHYSACAAWNMGSIASMKCDHCVNYERDNSGKCADQMFRELGFIKSRSADGTFVYQSDDDDIIIITKDFVRFTDCEQGYEFTMSSNPFLPIAQKLKEMENET